MGETGYTETNLAEGSGFDVVKNMDYNKALNILIESAKVAHKNGIFSFRDAIIIGGAIEYITKTPVK